MTLRIKHVTCRMKLKWRFHLQGHRQSINRLVSINRHCAKTNLCFGLQQTHGRCRQVRSDGEWLRQCKEDIEMAEQTFLSFSWHCLPQCLPVISQVRRPKQSKRKYTPWVHHTSGWSCHGGIQNKQSSTKTKWPLVSSNWQGRNSLGSEILGALAEGLTEARLYRGKAGKKEDPNLRTMPERSHSLHAIKRNATATQKAWVKHLLSKMRSGTPLHALLPNMAHKQITFIR